MAYSQIEIGNQALAMVGSGRIASWDDGSAEAAQLQQHYELTVGLALTSPGGAPFRWSFATRQERLVLLERAPDARFEHAYQMPADVLRIHAVTQGDALVRYSIHGDQIVTDDAGDLVADYTFRAHETIWPPDFTSCVVLELAAKLALGLNENEPLAKALRSQADWRGARTADSQARSSPRLRATRLTSARFGGWGRRW